MNQETTQNTQTVTFAVEGMTCGSCVRHVGEALNENFDQLTHQVDLRGSKLTVTFDPNSASEEAIAKVMNEAGYPVTKL